MTRWYLVHSKPGSEAVAEANLAQQGYEIYMPRLRLAIRRHGRWQPKIVPLFPRYLFLGLEEGVQVLSPVRSTIGVSSVVRFGSRYATVPDDLMRLLRLREDADSGLHRLRNASLPKKGSTVTLGCGPFGGLRAVYLRKCGTDRIVVLLSLLGADTSVTVPIDSMLPGSATRGRQ